MGRIVEGLRDERFGKLISEDFAHEATTHHRGQLLCFLCPRPTWLSLHLRLSLLNEHHYFIVQ